MHHATDHLGKDTRLVVTETRAGRNTDVQPRRAGRLAKALRANELQYRANLAGHFDHLVERVPVRIEVNDDEVGSLEMRAAGEPGIQLDATEVYEIQKRPTILTQNIVNRPPPRSRNDPLSSDPARKKLVMSL